MNKLPNEFVVGKIYTRDTKSVSSGSLKYVTKTPMWSSPKAAYMYDEGSIIAYVSKQGTIIVLEQEPCTQHILIEEENILFQRVLSDEGSVGWCCLDPDCWVEAV